MTEDINPEEGFTPEDLQELSLRFNRMEEDAKTGYSIELQVSRAAAREMVSIWLEALMGDKKSLAVCFDNYSYLVGEIMDALGEDDGALGQ